MRQLHICFRYNGEDYRGTAVPFINENQQPGYIVNIPGIKKDMVIVAHATENTWLAWKDYDTAEESMLIEMIGKAIERAR